MSAFWLHFTGICTIFMSFQNLIWTQKLYSVQLFYKSVERDNWFVAANTSKMYSCLSLYGCSRLCYVLSRFLYLSLCCTVNLGWRIHFYDLRIQLKKGLNSKLFYLNGTNNKISIWQLTNFHRSVSSTWKQTMKRINMNLKYTLRNILENSVTCMFFNKSVVAFVIA